MKYISRHPRATERYKVLSAISGDHVGLHAVQRPCPTQANVNGLPPLPPNPILLWSAPIYFISRYPCREHAQGRRRLRLALHCRPFVKSAPTPR